MNRTLPAVKASKSERTSEDPKPKSNCGDRISKSVLEQLGRPKGLHKVAAHNVYSTRWRVNVWVETKPGTVLIVHSYFVVASDGGEIISASPKIEKTY